MWAGLPLQAHTPIIRKPVEANPLDCEASSVILWSQVIACNAAALISRLVGSALLGVLSWSGVQVRLHDTSDAIDMVVFESTA